MLDITLVENSLKAMGGFEDGFEKNYTSFIQSAVKSVSEMIRDDADENDARLIQLAAAKAYYGILCSAERSNGVTSFSAGDISISEKSGGEKSAADFLRFALNECKCLIRNDSFAFMGM